MTTTLHILHGGMPPHTLPTQLITREHILALHKALLDRPIQGTPPNLWLGGCLHQGIYPPSGTYTCPHDCVSIAAANLLPKGQTRLNPCPPLGAPPAPSELDTVPKETTLRVPPLTGASLAHGTASNPQRANAKPSLDEGAERPKPSAHRTPISKSSPLLRMLSPRELPKRGSVAKCVQATRVKSNKN